MTMTNDRTGMTPNIGMQRRRRSASLVYAGISAAPR
jgi:hypothetical protein